MNKRKIYVVGSSANYDNWMQGEKVNTLDEADLVVFTGGEDVHPSIYSENKHHTTGSNFERDEYERVRFDRAVFLNKKIIGICRGSQLVCALNKGILVQHQDNPNYMHNINTYDGKVLNITSTHHQAAYPFRLSEDEYKVLGWTENMLPFHKGGNNEELNPKVECEIVYYPKTKSLGIQGHPEMMYPSRDQSSYETIQYLQDLLDKFMNNEL